MDGIAKIFQDVSYSVVKLKMYPYFDTCHFLLMCMAVRDDTPQTGSQAFSRKHPFACWLASMIMCFAGSILANFLIGEPLVTFLKHTDSIALATLVWYLVNYSPFDIVYRIARLPPVKFVICIMKEVQRTKKVYDGVAVAYKLFPGHHIIVVLVGVAKGAGSNLTLMGIRLIYGVFNPQKHEFLHPTFTTKASTLVGITFLLEKLGYLAGPHEQIYLGALLFLVYFRTSALLIGITDPLRPFENIFCAVFMGGLVDVISNASAQKSAASTPPPGSTYSHSNSSADANGADSAHTENGRPSGLPKGKDEKKNE